MRSQRCRHSDTHRINYLIKAMRKLISSQSGECAATKKRIAWSCRKRFGGKSRGRNKREGERPAGQQATAATRNGLRECTPSRGTMVLASAGNTRVLGILIIWICVVVFKNYKYYIIMQHTSLPFLWKRSYKASNKLGKSIIWINEGGKCDGMCVVKRCNLGICCDRPIIFHSKRF